MRTASQHETNNSHQLSKQQHTEWQRGRKEVRLNSRDGGGDGVPRDLLRGKFVVQTCVRTGKTKQGRNEGEKARAM